MSFGSIADRVTLSGGVEAPRYVFGTGGIFDAPAIHHALTVGYRAFDTAQMYQNEREVGQALRSYSGGDIPRSELFVISKVEKPGKDVEETFEGIKESVEKIGMGYVDLFLVHNPKAGPAGRKIQWLALERAKREGLVRAIGVSNYVVHHLEGMKEYGTEMPAVNQTELTPFNQDPAVATWCKENKIQLQSFAPVARAQKADDPTLLEIAKEVNKKWSSVMLRWNWQRGYMVTCKSATPSRITENTDIFDFELSDDQMTRLDSLDSLECGFKVTPSWLSDPAARRKYYEDMP